MPSGRKLRLCNNKSALEQRAEEADLSLAQLHQFAKKRQNRQYHDPASVVGGKGLEMADAIDIADRINLLAASLKDIDESTKNFDMAAFQQSLQQASETIESINKQRSPDGPSKGVTFYDGKMIPKSPLKTSNVQTPRRSNVSTVSQAAMACPSPQRLLQTASTAALSCSSGYLATIGEISPPTSPGLVELSEDEEYKPTPGRKKKGKKLSLDFSDFPLDGEGKKNIRIKKGDVAIKVWGKSVGGLTLTTGGPSSSGENDSPASTPSRETNVESSNSKAQSRSNFGQTSTRNPKYQSPQKKLLFPWQKKTDTRPRHNRVEASTNDAAESTNVTGVDLENLVLGAMNPSHTFSSLHPISRTKQKERSYEEQRKEGKPASADELLPVMSNLSYVSEMLPNDRFGGKKFQTVKTDDEKGFEVYLDGSSSTSRYSSRKLRERAALSEKLRSKRREIMSIQQDLDACSLLLGKCNETNMQKHSTLRKINEHRKDDSHADGQAASLAIVRE